MSLYFDTSTMPNDPVKEVNTEAIPEIRYTRLNTQQPIELPKTYSNNAIAAPVWTKMPLYIDPNNTATQYLATNPNSADAQFVRRQAGIPVAKWFGGWNKNVESDVRQYVWGAQAENKVPVVVAYDIPFRDCGLYSAGGAASNTAYLDWVMALSRGIGDSVAVIILEPDALAGLDCLPSQSQLDRYNALSQAVTIIKKQKNAVVYIDAGNPSWKTVDVISARLKLANIAGADGFSLNVSNFVGTATNQVYGDAVSKNVDNKHYVIDTSRNGINNLNPQEWCNNMGAALGATPTASTGNPRNDALLWIKIPWESDGSCNGAPEAGVGYWTFAAQLAKNAGW